MLVVFPADNGPLVLVVVVRLVAVSCLFTESLICFSVSAPFAPAVFDSGNLGFGGPAVGDFDVKLVGGLGFAVVVFGELAVVLTLGGTVV